MTTAAIRKKVADYVKTANIKKVRAIYTMIEDEIETKPDEWDEEFIKELDRREKSFLNGTAKMYTLEEAKHAARERLKITKK
jgi:vacuolar-type H+-ATPase subunit B/Vma2